MGQVIVGIQRVVIDNESLMQMAETDAFYHLFNNCLKIRFHRQQRVEPLQKKDPGTCRVMEIQCRPKALNDVVAFDTIDTETVDQSGQL